MLNKLLGGGKKKEFFLELDDTEVTQATAEVKEKPAEPVATQPVEATTEVKEVAPEPATKKPSKKTSIKKKAVKKEAKKGTPKTEIVPTTPALTSEKSTPKEEPKQVEFATKFFMNSTPRRRPGPSLNPFRNMASEVKVPRR